MHRETHRTLRLAGLLIAATAGAACGSGSDAGPAQSPLVIAKAATKSGDAQTGPVSQALPSSLRVVVTRDGTPEADVTVTWSAAAGAVGLGTDQTGANGESTSLGVWGDQAGPQSASASVTGATGSPVTFTATATCGPPAATVQVLVLARGNRFSPAEITVVAGHHGDLVELATAPPHPAVEAEVVHAVRREMAQTVEDVHGAAGAHLLRDAGSRGAGRAAGGGADGARARMGRGAGGGRGREVRDVRGGVAPAPASELRRHRHRPGHAAAAGRAVRRAVIVVGARECRR